MTLTEAIEAMEAAREEFPSGTVWRHVKGAVYVVSEHGLLEATLEPCISYYGAGDDRDWVIWVRPVSEFRARFSKVRLAR